ncbi:hypothetical protein ANN_15481 [Periplaneta americana]|uniref:Uncharacterized protein n=1 Tax=Periplaneta americana TaxID=6978 RepID=A0ABQ8SGX3_PERAM|nr:hypothetical protein ANN_15481 [Periplaneta americana]
MAGLCEDGNEPPGSLKASGTRHTAVTSRDTAVIIMKYGCLKVDKDIELLPLQAALPLHLKKRIHVVAMLHL